MKQRTMLSFKRTCAIDTPSMNWAKVNGACFEGRQRLGLRSIGEYWNAADAEPGHLCWIARHLACNNYGYTEAVNRAYTSGRWGAKRTREKLRSIMSDNSVQIPAWLL